MAWPDGRKPGLVTGSVLALLAGIAGIIGTTVSNSPAVPVGVLFSAQCAYAVPVAVAVATLATRGRQTYMLVLLLGMSSTCVVARQSADETSPGEAPAFTSAAWPWLPRSSPP